MKLRLIALCAVLAALLINQSALAGQQTVTLAAYNIENAFDVFDNPYTDDQDNEVKPRSEWEAIANVLRQVNPDVCAFSELENEYVLHAMVSDFLPGAGYHYVAADHTNSTRGINLGIISRLPILSLTSYRFLELTLPGEEQTWTFARDLWRVTLEAPDGKPLDVFVVHLKSRHDSDDDPNSAKWRLAEASMARRIIDGLLEQNPEARLAIMGDFNDTPGDPAISALTSGKSLIDVHANLPAEQRITYLRKPYRSTIDYILASPALVNLLVPGSPRVLQDERLLGGSDHAPVIATFRFESAE
ncbi:MAG: endonuclease/exonuclease/phosphatase family protein [Phycisphaeraceae bacterium]|nr:endonuclease/exonuclease/phosphatase family protein [Phycisphaeraceae bacterium]